jgi:hypothetical protein
LALLPFCPAIALSHQNDKAMFTKTILLATITLLGFTKVSANNTSDSTLNSGLEISFKLTDDGSRVSDYSVIIYQDGNAMDTIFIGKSKPVSIWLDYNHNYALRHIKAGYRDRIVLIDTHISQKSGSDIMDFDYEIELIRENEAANTFDDFPVAFIHYDASQKKFDYSRKYDRQVRHRFNNYVVN